MGARHFSACLLNVYVHVDDLRSAANRYVQRDAIVNSRRSCVTASTATTASSSSCSTTATASAAATAGDRHSDSHQGDKRHKHLCVPAPHRTREQTQA